MVDGKWLEIKILLDIVITNFNTPYRIANFVKDVFTDPSWWQRFLYGYYDSWLWQYGGKIQIQCQKIKITKVLIFM